VAAGAAGPCHPPVPLSQNPSLCRCTVKVSDDPLHVRASVHHVAVEKITAVLVARVVNFDPLSSVIPADPVAPSSQPKYPVVDG
jgi:hypothetical protein